MREHPFVVMQTNRFTAAVRKLLGIKGEKRDISFGVHLEDERPEYSFLKGEILFCQTNEVTSGAGDRAIIGVRNPANSGVLLVITACFAEAAAAAVNLQLGFAAGASIAGGGGMQPRDLRVRNNGLATTCTAFVGLAAGSGYTGIYTILQTLVARQPVDFMVARVGPIIIPPGNEIHVSPDANGVNTVRATFAGYERSLESGELI